MFLNIWTNVYLVKFEDILNIETENGARIRREANINVDFQFLLKVFLVNNHITAYSRTIELKHCHQDQDKEQNYANQ